MLRPDRSAKTGVLRTRSWHASTGVWLLTALLVLTTTGLTWSAYAGQRFDLVQEQLDADRLTVDTALAAAASGSTDSSTAASIRAGLLDEDSDLSRIDAVLAGARGHGLDGPVEITPGAGEAWTVAQDDNVWPVRRDVVAVNPATGTITDHVPWDDQPLFAKLTTYGIQAHMGVLFGPINQIALALTAIGLLGVIFWGYRMWWQRRPTRADARRPFGKPPARGTLRRLPAPVVATIAIAVAAIGWALPLLGWSLLAFLATDSIAGLTHRLRATRERTM